LTHLAVERHVSASTQNQAKAAILLLYKEVLQQVPATRLALASSLSDLDIVGCKSGKILLAGVDVCFRRSKSDGILDCQYQDGVRACSKMAVLDNTVLKLALECLGTHLYTQIYTLGFFSQFRLVLSSFAYL
jgi:hypothetical protein